MTTAHFSFVFVPSLPSALSSLAHDSETHLFVDDALTGVCKRLGSRPSDPEGGLLAFLY